MRASLFISALMVVVQSGFGQHTAAWPSVEEQAKTCHVIFEGKVISKTSYQAPGGKGIFTVNRIEVYKVFKGNFQTGEMKIITPGGQVGMEAESSSEGPEFRLEDTGVFFCDTSAADLGNALTSCCVPRGFIKYDRVNKTAADGPAKYNDIEKEVYLPITRATGLPYKAIKPFSLKD